MERDRIIDLIRLQMPQLRELGVKSLAVFGSVASSNQTSASDVDVLVEFEGPATFDAFMEVKFLLEDMIQMPVDLVTPQALKPRMRPSIEREAIYVA